MQQPKRKEPDRKAPLHSSATRRLDRQRPGTASRQALPGAERGRCGYRKGDIVRGAVGGTELIWMESELD